MIVFARTEANLWVAFVQLRDYFVHKLGSGLYITDFRSACMHGDSNLISWKILFVAIRIIII